MRTANKNSAWNENRPKENVGEAKQTLLKINEQHKRDIWTDGGFKYKTFYHLSARLKSQINVL